MSRTTTPMTEGLEAYMRQVGVREPARLASLREETARMPEAGMQTAPEQGQLLHLLVKLTGARTIVEVGTFTGYSSTWMALALPEDGRLICCDVSEVYTAAARSAWEDCNVADRIDLRIAPALETLGGLAAGSVDMVFLDADKEHYPDYWQEALRILRPGGLVCADNVLWHGAVVDVTDDADTTTAIRAFNEAAAADERVDLVLVPIGDGLTLARKR